MAMSRLVRWTEERLREAQAGRRSQAERRRLPSFAPLAPAAATPARSPRSQTSGRIGSRGEHSAPGHQCRRGGEDATPEVMLEVPPPADTSPTTQLESAV